MSFKSKVTKAATAALLAGTAVVGLTGTANADTNSRYIGDGYSNNTHAVWCAQHSINYASAHWGFAIPGIAQIAEDGAWGPQTKSAVEWLQHANGLNADGVVGSNTGHAMLIEGDPYYNGSGGVGGYCYGYLPTY